MWQKKWGHWVCGRGTLRSKHCHSCLQNPGAEEILLALPKRRLIELNPQFMSLFKSIHFCLSKRISTLDTQFWHLQNYRRLDMDLLMLKVFFQS